MLVREERQSWFDRATEPSPRRDEPPLCPDTGGIHAPEGRGHTGRAAAAGGRRSGCSGAVSRPRWLRSRTVRPYRSTRAGPRGSPTSTCATIPRTSTVWSTRSFPRPRPLRPACSSGERRLSGLIASRIAFADRDRSQMEIAEELSKAVRSKTMARAFVQRAEYVRRPPWPDARCSTCCRRPISRSSEQVLPGFMAKVYREPRFPDGRRRCRSSASPRPASRSCRATRPGLIGVSTRDIAQTLQDGLPPAAQPVLGHSTHDGKQYEILGEINRQQRNKPTDLKSIYVRSEAGEMVQLDNLVSLQEAVAPPQLYRYNRFVSATVSAGGPAGRRRRDRAGPRRRDRIARETLDDTFRTALAGDSKEFREEPLVEPGCSLSCWPSC